MGLSTRRSWDLTPREFAALEKVYRDTLQRWSIEQAHVMNAPHVTHKDKRPWAWYDFLDTPEARQHKQQLVVDKLDMARIKREEMRQTQLMRAGKFPEDQLPAWARMTPEEKAKRGIQ